MSQSIRTGCVLAFGLLLLAGCGGSTSTSHKQFASTAETCMGCHNGSSHDDYAGNGIENPHPFPGAGAILCSTCHGGNPTAQTANKAHVPPPPEIGDRQQQANDALAYFNRLTLTGIDKFPDYAVDGVTWTAIDYLQFVNPGDLRVVDQGRACGQCHQSHVDSVTMSMLATEAGIFSGAMYAVGEDNAIPAHAGLFGDTAADLGWRAKTDNNFVLDLNRVGAIGDLLEFPVFSVRGATGATDLDNNPLYAAANLPADRQANGQVVPGSNLANLLHEQMAFTCGDCHLGSAGANNRYGDFRSSGCTACHMPYSLDGRAGSKDKRIRRNEPANPDNIDEPERAHVRKHQIVSIAKTLTTGEQVMGMDDYTCAGCHQGSNRTVMQYWGIRLDQNQDVRRRVQYPTNPVSFQDTRDDTRLFDPRVQNNTFNGRNAGQYLLFEDYDGDGRDDTPPDVHYEAGLGCIDCHGSHDLHGGSVGNQAVNGIQGRQEQGVAIQCESCHGSADAYATTVASFTYDGNPATTAVDAEGNPLPHVTLEADGNYYLTSRLTGNRHYVSQVRDVIVDSGKVNPYTNNPVYSPHGSYAMGRVDNDANTGLGPQQNAGPITPNFSHMDNMSCTACHSSWTNNCVGCHLEGEYDTGNNFSNITGQRIVFEEQEADFVYQSPVMFALGIDSHGKIAPTAGNTAMWFLYEDLNNQRSERMAFSDRNGQGADTTTSTFPSLGHNALMPHSIRGRLDARNEGPRYCVSCHLTEGSLRKYGAEYTTFFNEMAVDDYTNLDFPMLAQHIGANPGNQMDSPFWVHGVAGLGTGLFLFDEHGCPVNPLDTDDQRKGCNFQAPATNFLITDAYYNLDKMVTPTGRSTGSNNHAFLLPGTSPLRDNAADPTRPGPMGQTLLQRLADPNAGIVLDSWLTANRKSRGFASDYIGQ